MFFTLAISKCYGKVRVLFFRATTLSFQTASRIIDFFGLAVRCLLFNPEGPGSNPCLCANFFYKIFEAEDSHFFRQYETPLPLFSFLRLIFENFLMSPKGPPFIFLIFCNRTNVKKFKRASFRFFGTMRLLKIRIFSKIFRSLQMVPLQFFWNIAKEWMLKNLKEPPFHSFRPCEIFQK